MGRGLVKVNDYYCEWSTVVDAPVSQLITYDMAVAKWGMERVNRARDNGHSYQDQESDHEYWSSNRSGPKEDPLTAEGLIAAFGYDSPLTKWPDVMPVGWINHALIALWKKEKEADERRYNERHP